MFKEEFDENYYDTNGKRLCDKTGCNIYVNDGNQMYDIETSKVYERILEEDDENPQFHEITFVSFSVQLISFIITLCKKIYNCFYNSLKNRYE
jgi:hypothetical protein